MHRLICAVLRAVCVCQRDITSTTSSVVSQINTHNLCSPKRTQSNVSILTDGDSVPASRRKREVGIRDRWHTTEMNMIARGTIHKTKGGGPLVGRGDERAKRALRLYRRNRGLT